jgi:GT2 family glycosyltransferase
MNSVASEPLVSVVIPTCRRPDLLSQCLQRLAPGAQTFPADQYEVIVTDDGEPTVEALIAKQFPWARWSAGPRRGPAANRNSGAQAAHGRWIAFTDDDCLPDSAWLSGFHAVAHEGCLIYEGRTTCAAGIASPLFQAPVNTTGGLLWSCNLLVDRTTFARIGGFDEKFPHPHMEDVDFRERVLALGLTFEFVSGALVDHPPRRVAPAWRLARSHESFVYHWYKNDRREFAAFQVLFGIIRFRLFSLWRYKLGIDTLRAICSVAIEFGVTTLLLPSWELKHRWGVHF